MDRADDRSDADLDPDLDPEHSTGGSTSERPGEEVTADELVERTRRSELASSVHEIVTYTIVAGAVSELGDVAMKAIAGLIGVGWDRSGPLRSFARGNRRPGLRTVMREPGGGTVRLEFTADPSSDGAVAGGDLAGPERGTDGSRPDAAGRRGSGRDHPARTTGLER